MLALFLPVLFLAQAQTFDVASVKASNANTTRKISGGPGSTHPGSATFENVDLFSIVTMAYDIKAFQLSGPSWIRSTRYDITAKIPAGATPAQYRTMLRNLLAERFKLVTSTQKKQGDVYGLVAGKGGPKFKESAPDSASSDDGIQPPRTISPPPGYNGPVNMQVRQFSMEMLAGTLSGYLGRPVIDETNLTGRYDITLKWTGLQPRSDNAAQAPDGIPTVFDAIQEQLGLKLVSKKGIIDLLVIEGMEKTPTEN